MVNVFLFDVKNVLLMFSRVQVTPILFGKVLLFIEVVDDVTMSLTYIRIVLQKDSPILYKFEVKKRQESTKQERQRVVCITTDYLIEKWADHVIGIHR